MPTTTTRLILRVQQHNRKLRNDWPKLCRELGVAFHAVQELGDFMMFDCHGTPQAVQQLLAATYVVGFQHPASATIGRAPGSANREAHERAKRLRRKARIAAMREKQEHFASQPIDDLLPARSGTL